jgi:hypothetical protein
MEAAHETAAPALVELPEIENLSDAQADGRQCVWCQLHLLHSRSIDLGERMAEERRIFPRGCRACVTRYVYRQLLAHSGSCEQCADDASLCADTADLRRILREARR